MILIFSFILSLQSFANDPWATVDAFVGKQSLCQSMPASGSFMFNRYVCTEHTCEKWDYEVKVTCGPNSKGAEVAEFKFYKKNGSIFSEQKLEAYQWNNVGGNLLRLKKQNAESFGLTFELLNATLVDSTLKAEYQVTQQNKVIEKGYWIMKSASFMEQQYERHVEVLHPMTETRIDKLLN